MNSNLRRFVQLAILLLCLAALVWTAHSLGPRRLWAAVRSADPFWLGLSALAVAGRFLIWSAKWQRMLCRREAVSFGLSLRLVLVGSFINLTTPTAKLAGGVVRALLLARHRRWPVLDAYGWALADQITNVLGQFLLYGVLAVGAFQALPPGSMRDSLLISGLVVVGAVLTLGALRGLAWRGSRRPEIARVLVRLVPRRFRATDSHAVVHDGLGRMLHPLLRQDGMISTYLLDVLLAAVGFASLCLSNALVLRALGAEASVVVVSVAVMGAYFAGTVIGAWGGIGVTEAMLTGLFVQAGIPLELAASGALIHRGMFYGVVLAAGGPALLNEVRTGWDPRRFASDAHSERVPQESL